MKLRYYQEEAIQAVIDYFMEKAGNPIVAMPTGTGKSVVIAELVRQMFGWASGQRYIVLTHVKELIAQNFEKELLVWPTAPAGIYSSGLNRKDEGCPITFAGIQSVWNRAAMFGRVDIVFVDECHLINPKANGMYNKFLDALKEINPLVKVIGLTATDYRLGLGKLTEGGFFTDVCYDITKKEDFNRLIAEGFLTTLIPKRTNVEIDAEGVHIKGGEYVQAEAEAAADKITYQAVRELVEYGHDRSSWLIFASGIDHALNVGDMLKDLGIPTIVIHSKMSDDARDKGLEDFKAGKYRACVNNGILTTGFDHPAIDLIGVLRLTNSPGLWVQMLGRGTRPVYAPGYDLETIEGRLAAIEMGGKPNCLVLDFAGNTRRLGPINDPIIPRPRGKGEKGDAPIRICDECGTYNHASARFCFNCGQEFPRETKIQRTAGTDELIADGKAVYEIFPVDRVVYSEHRKEGRPSTIMVQYYCGLRMFKEYVCLEHEGYARKRSRDWWRDRAQQEPPETTMGGLLYVPTLRTPTHIKVWVNKQYPEVTASYYEGENPYV